MAEATNDANQDGGAENSSEQAKVGISDAAARMIEDLRVERDRYLEIAQRARAELDNYQKRASREMQSERKFAAQPIIIDLLPAIDNLERAIESARKQIEDSGIIEGLELVVKQLLDGLAKHGIAPISPVDEPFDPNLHEAVSQHATSDVPPMTVLMTLQKGYSLHERVIRPAQVLVSGPVG